MKKIIYIALALILIGAIGGLIVFQTTDLFQTSKASAQTKTASVNGIKKINVDVSSLDVEVKKTNRDQLSAKVKGWGNKQMIQGVKLAINKEGDALHVTAVRNQSFFTFTIGWSKLIIEVPEQAYNQITVDVGSGDLSIEDLQAGHLSLTSGSGDVTAKNNKSRGNFIVQASSGDIDMQHNQARNEARVSANSGDLDVSDLTAKSTRLETASGDIDVQRYSGSLIAQANSGDLDIESHQLSGDIDAQVASGDIDINFAQDPDALSVDYRGGSGEGKVNLDGFLYKEKTDHLIIGQKGDGKYKIRVRTNSGDFNLQ
ncbi:DUF4097 family beta strand repeat-containing protein [Sporolactobacillus terrae]|uniref:DUF4097 family beta strand repeat-containing protein n=1 Tax=Sporolactobacillus terrae TaxID=269673 RepID=UPI00111B04CA|nr:DUF4097 family beta strand repeat-containing protein [Sporolactobacillus terrae]